MVTPYLCHLRSYGNWHPHRVAMGCRLSNGEGRAVGTPGEGRACCQGGIGRQSLKELPPLLGPTGLQGHVSPVDHPQWHWVDDGGTFPAQDDPNLLSVSFHSGVMK